MVPNHQPEFNTFTLSLHLVEQKSNWVILTSPTQWRPLVISWFTTPSNYRSIPPKPVVIVAMFTNLAILGAPHCGVERCPPTLWKTMFFFHRKPDLGFLKPRTLKPSAAKGLKASTHLGVQSSVRKRPRSSLDALIRQRSWRIGEFFFFNGCIMGYFTGYQTTLQDLQFTANENLLDSWMPMIPKCDCGISYVLIHLNIIFFRLGWKVPQK